MSKSLYETWMSNLQKLIELNNAEENKEMARLYSSYGDYLNNYAFGQDNLTDIFRVKSAAEIKREKKMAIQADINTTEAKLRQLKKDLEKASLPEEPSDGSTIKFVHTYDFSGDYTFVAYRHGNTWYASGTIQGQRQFTWAQLVKKMNKGTFTKLADISTVTV